MTVLSRSRAVTGTVRALAVLVVAGPLAGCGAAAEGGAPAPVVRGEPPTLTDAGLTDSVVPGDGGRVSWTTTWRACFGSTQDEAVAGWESQAVTSEGSSPEVEELPEGCLDLDVATGTNAADAGMVGREIQLSDAQALAYRVRAVRADDTVSAWTDPVRVGTVTPG